MAATKDTASTQAKLASISLWKPNVCPPSHILDSALTSIFLVLKKTTIQKFLNYQTAALKQNQSNDNSSHKHQIQNLGGTCRVAPGPRDMPPAAGSPFLNPGTPTVITLVKISAASLISEYYLYILVL